LHDGLKSFKLYSEESVALTAVFAFVESDSSKVHFKNTVRASNAAYDPRSPTYQLDANVIGSDAFGFIVGNENHVLQVFAVRRRLVITVVSWHGECIVMMLFVWVLFDCLVG
jgi:hypothetical protein